MALLTAAGLWALAFACPGRRGAEVDPAQAPDSIFQDVPRLPAPEGLVYTTRDAEPPDPAVAAVLGDLSWDEALSGGASGLLLQTMQGVEPDLYRMRWAAWRAGFPHPVVWTLFESCETGCAGNAVITALREARRPGDRVGLARGRSGEGDHWLGALGRPRVALRPFPRRVETGEPLPFALAEDRPSARVALVSPTGRTWRGSPAALARLRLLEDGEWWLELTAQDQILLALPLYVGVDPAIAPPLDSVPPPSEEELFDVDVAWECLETVRVEFDLSSLEEDPILSARARARLRWEHFSQGAQPPSPEPGAESCDYAMRCAAGEDRGLLGCFQDWLVEAESRRRLLDARCALAGMAVGGEGEGRWLYLELGVP